MSTFSFELVAPERLLVSRAVSMVTVPGEEGDFGVLAGHAPLVSSLRVGVIEVQGDAGQNDRFFVAGGFAEVSPERCTVLADVALPVSELNADVLTAEAEKLQAELLVAENETDKTRLAAALALNAAKLAVVTTKEAIS